LAVNRRQNKKGNLRGITGDTDLNGKIEKLLAE
jgi:hypothetical protein